MKDSTRDALLKAAVPIVIAGIVVGGGIGVFRIVLSDQTTVTNAATQCPQPPSAPTPTDEYASCVAKIFLRKSSDTKSNEVEVKAAAKDLVEFGPREKREHAWNQLQQRLTDQAQLQALSDCARAAGDKASVQLLAIEVKPARQDVTVEEMSAGGAVCKTKAHGGCLLALFDATGAGSIRIKAYNETYESATRAVTFEEVKSGLVTIDIESRPERLLTIVATDSGHAFLGWVRVRPTFSVNGELTRLSTDCYPYRWDEATCHEARADELGRVEFKYSGALESLQVELRDYRPSVIAWTGVPTTVGTVSVDWPSISSRSLAAGSKAAPKSSAPSKIDVVVPCGSRPAVESLLSNAPWPKSGLFSVQLTIDAAGQATKIDGVPDPVSSFIRARRVAVAAGCESHDWQVGYAAKGID